MNDAKLTIRELQIAELIAWGASKKEIANKLFISVRTVENHARAIYEKINCNSATALSAWWFCTHYNIPQKYSPLARVLVVFIFLSSYFIGSFNPNADDFRTPTRTARTVRTIRSTRRNENTYILSW